MLAHLKTSSTDAVNYVLEHSRADIVVVGDSETLAKVKEIFNKNHPIMRRYPSQKENWQQWFSTKELEELEEMMVELERFLGVASCSLEILFLIVSC